MTIRHYRLCRTCQKPYESSTICCPANLWDALHQYPIKHLYTWNPSNAQTFFDKWLEATRKLPCKCTRNFNKYLDTQPPKLSTSIEFFSWTVSAHNYISVHHATPRKAEISTQDAWKIHLPNFFQETPQDLKQLPQIRNPLAIITIAVGKEYEILFEEFTQRAMQKYANKIKADLIVLKGKTQKWWGLEKFRIRPFFDFYERILFLDCDILIRENAPNIFNNVPETHIGVVDDTNALSDTRWCIRERIELANSQFVQPYLPNTLYNSGVMVCSKLHADVFTPPEYPIPGNHVDEQFWIERHLIRYAIKLLDIKWNTQTYYSNFSITRDSAYFLHTACCDIKDKRNIFTQEITNNYAKKELELNKLDWDQFKQLKLVNKYPPSKFNIPKDESGWATNEGMELLENFSKNLNENACILELGSFLGAKSTQAFIKNIPNRYLITIDSFKTKAEDVLDSDKPYGNTPFFLKQGSQWEHFVNNTFEIQDRVAPITCFVNTTILTSLSKMPFNIELIYIDADHELSAILIQLKACLLLWPKATILLDDHTDIWPDIKTAINILEEKGTLTGYNKHLHQNRIMELTPHYQ